MNLKLQEIKGGCWIVSDNFGRWFGEGVSLSKDAARVMKEAMEHAYGAGQEDVLVKVRDALGMESL